MAVQSGLCGTASKPVFSQRGSYNTHMFTSATGMVLFEDLLLILYKTQRPVICPEDVLTCALFTDKKTALFAACERNSEQLFTFPIGRNANFGPVLGSFWCHWRSDLFSCLLNILISRQYNWRGRVHGTLTILIELFQTGWSDFCLKCLKLQYISLALFTMFCRVTVEKSLSETAVWPGFILIHIVTSLKGTHFRFLFYMQTYSTEIEFLFNMQTYSGEIQ